MKALFDYFEQNWNRKPYPVIDHSLRVNRQADGSFHFYIHPSNEDGVTLDFIVDSKFLKIRPSL